MFILESKYMTRMVQKKKNIYICKLVLRERKLIPKVTSNDNDRQLIQMTLEK